MLFLREIGSLPEATSGTAQCSGHRRLCGGERSVKMDDEPNHPAYGTAEMVRDCAAECAELSATFLSGRRCGCGTTTCRDIAVRCVARRLTRNAPASSLPCWARMRSSTTGPTGRSVQGSSIDPPAFSRDTGSGCVLPGREAAASRGDAPSFRGVLDVERAGCIGGPRIASSPVDEVNLERGNKLSSWGRPRAPVSAALGGFRRHVGEFARNKARGEGRPPRGRAMDEPGARSISSAGWAWSVIGRASATVSM